MSMAKSKSKPGQPTVRMDAEVVRQVRQHARSSSRTEVCGILIGRERNNALLIQARIPGLNAAEAGTHVTFTQDTWEHVYKIKDRDYPEQRIVGWYHSHPGFGVFLSDHDTFIHKNFFSSPFQVAWVYDPHSDEEGCFGWAGERLERLTEIVITDSRGGEGAGETGKPEPVVEAEGRPEAGRETGTGEAEPPAWVRWTGTILSHALVLLVGFLISWFLFPRDVYVPIPVDPQTGRPLLNYPDEKPGGAANTRSGEPGSTEAKPTPPPEPESGKVKNAPKQ